MQSAEFLKRLFDLFCSVVLLMIFVFPLAILLLLVKLTSKGPVIHWSKRIGLNNDIFLMPKIRSMTIDTPQLATDLLSSEAKNYVTPVGKFLRKTSFDELPQLWSVLSGDMSFVGPRPALFNQYNLTQLRTEKNIHKLKPGITGWAQINGRDTVNDEQKVKLDEYYLQNKSLLLDVKILLLTASRVVKSTDVTH